MKKSKFNFLALGCAIFLMIGCSNNTDSNKSDEGSSESSVATEETNTPEEAGEKKSVIIGNLEVSGADHPEKMKYFLAMEECKKVDGGWRLPTIEEWHMIYENRDKIGGFDDYGTYWSSNTNEDEPTQAWVLSFHDGKQYNMSKSDYNYSIRMVRDK